MASQTALHLKAKWMRNPESFFEPLTFGEVKLGQTFISLPEPGDNEGHGGLRGAQYLFIKTQQLVPNAGCGLSYSSPHGSATNVKRNLSSDFPDSELVILVE